MITSSPCTLLACQAFIPQTRSKKDKDHHVDRLITRISRYLDNKPADMVVLPELSTIEYSKKAFVQLELLAEPLDGLSVEKMQRLALKYQVAVLFGMPRISEGNFYISQIMIGANGKVAGCYDKLHLCQYGASMEKMFFQRGDNLYVFSLAGLKFAPIICYDIRFSELSHVLTLKHGIDCLLHCGAYFKDTSFATWQSFTITRAMENQIYLLSLNRAGKHYGGSHLCLPWMNTPNEVIKFHSSKENFRYITLDKTIIQNARENYTFLKDALDNYSNLPWNLKTI